MRHFVPTLLWRQVYKTINHAVIPPQLLGEVKFHSQYSLAINPLAVVTRRNLCSLTKEQISDTQLVANISCSGYRSRQSII